MIDPSFDTATITPYPPTMQELEIKAADLENKLRYAEEHWEIARQRIQAFTSQIRTFENALKDNEWDFDSDTLQSLADFFGIELEREFEVTITVTFTGTVSVPMDYDMDDLENDLSASLDTHHYGNSSVVVDLSEDSMEIDYREF